jgi:predicted RNA-binding protein (virulence factor B family)
LFQLGKYNKLLIHRFTSVGAYLGEPDADYENVVLLPNKYLKPGMQEGQEVEVFIYLDSDERPVATTLKPLITLGDFATLEVKQVSRVGAFLDMGLEKDVFVPYGEMVERMHVGERYLVGLYLDDQTGRLAATPRVGKLFDQKNIQLILGQEVDLVVYNETELGFQVMINKKYGGLVYHNEVFGDLDIGDERKGYIKQIRPDGKIDVSMQPLGVASIEPNAQKILDMLNQNRGMMYLSDKSKPEDIESQTGMSKKAFKKAIGSLYKQRLIAIEDDHIKTLIQNYTPEGPKHLRKKEK